MTTLKGQIITQFEGDPAFVSYSVTCEHEGGTELVELSCRFGGIETNLSLNRTKDDRWFCNGSEVRPCLGLKDVDLGVTPSTNSLPIRRVKLAPGESRELGAVWLRFPDLTLTPRAQRYTRIDSTTYLYQSIKSGYEARIYVDSDGSVVEYEDAWQRSGH